MQSKGERIRGRKRQAICARVLSANPLCVQCQKQGKVSIATQVDHIIAIVNGGVDDPHDDSNRQGLCDPCHKVKTAKDMGYKERTKFDRQGRVVW